MKKFLLFIAIVVSISWLKSDATKQYEYKTAIVFYMNSEYVAKYPNITMGFHNAVKEWNKVLPVEIYIKVVNEDVESYALHVKDFGDPAKTNIRLGAYLSTNKLIFIDNDVETLKPKRTPPYNHLPTAVIVHELGHYFGLRHVVSRQTYNKITGDVLLPSEPQARYSIMYPSLGECTNPGKILPLEIQLAKRVMEKRFFLPESP